MSLGLLGLAGLLLSVERVCYAWIARELRAIGPVLYCNTGDWVESGSALAEREDGTLTLLAFAERARAATARRDGSG